MLHLKQLGAGFFQLSVKTGAESYFYSAPIILLLGGTFKHLIKFHLPSTLSKDRSIDHKMVNATPISNTNGQGSIFLLLINKVIVYTHTTQKWK